MIKRILFLSLAIGLTGSIACVASDTDDEPDGVEDTGIQMVVDLPTDPGVQGIQVSIFECGDTRPLLVDQTELADGTLPDARPDRTDLPFDDDAQHLFADYFAALDTGCYDIEVVPIDEHGELVLGCTEAVAHDVEVKKKLTTEILLVSQCDQPTEQPEIDNDLRDGDVLDVIAAINHPPEIEMVEATPSMSLKCPSATVELCTKVIEPDHDPVVFDWIQLEGPEVLEGPIETLFEVEDGVTTKCVEYEFRDETANYLFELTVFDYFVVDGEFVTAEQWFIREDHGPVQSRDTATIPIHVECPVDKKPEDVLEEVEKKEKEDDKKKKDEPEDVLDEIEDDKDKKDYDDKDEKKKKDEPEDVLDEIEDDKDKKDYDDKDEKKKKDEPEDVLDEIEDDKDKKEYEDDKDEKKKKDEPEDVLDEIEDIDKKEKEDDEKKKKKDDYDE